ncbi:MULTISPECIES: hypothetical protein [unclassified Sporosarcina]|uniref:hypothetical protein n=1 Tax=unclassified Sporosarcina TaxID=2647733 RepID=UPI00203DFF60|nr:MULTISPECIES: hypothetical protein [unclassified Sporosarcina]GKV65191.1 hypothetical protein NCCP2331_13440 [Sporosarcina sp. NCCP-2331]GLB55315.1 hypothetical protein NCCP2378_11010 [Sporosarcina sp. NCCP-2378]
MTAKTKEYLHAGIMVIVIVAVLFIFDLPKTPLLTLIILLPLMMIMQVLFPRKKKVGKKREFIVNIVLFAVFCLVIYVFDLPLMLYAVMAILFLSNILLAQWLGED